MPWTHEIASVLLSVDNLNVRFNTADGEVHAVRDLSFAIEQGDSLAIVGESGSGKSQTCLALMGLVARNGRVDGKIQLNDQHLDQLSARQWSQIRGNEIAMIFQDPMTCLNPYQTVAAQMTEVLRHHQGSSKKDALTESVRMLDAVHIPDTTNRIKQYPHEFSGGMRQRVMIAMSLLCRPKLLLADEPTTALDVTVQAQILDLLRELQTEFSTSIVMVTHDLGVVAGLCNRVAVMYGGRIVEAVATKQLFESPQHPYTQALLQSIPDIDSPVTEKLQTIAGQPPSLTMADDHCAFADRCPQVFDRCLAERPPLIGSTTTAEAEVACWRIEQLPLITEA